MIIGFISVRTLDVRLEVLLMPRIAVANFSERPSQVLGMFFDTLGHEVPNSAALLKQLEEDVVAYRKSRTSITVISANADPYGYDGETVISASVPSYNPIISEFSVRELPSNAPFLKRKRAKEVVLSSCDHSYVRVESYPGLSGKNPMGTLAGLEVDGNWLVRNCGWSRVWWPLAQRYAYNPRGNAAVFAINLFVSNITYDYFADMEVSRPHEISAEEVYHLVRETNHVDTELVTSTVADANKRMLDLMTTMAELPEALKSAKDILALTAKIIIDFKRKKFSLTQAFEDKKKYLDRRNVESLVAIDRELASLSSEDLTRREIRRRVRKRYRFLQQQKIRMQKQHTKAIKKSEIEFYDAVSSTWLNFRYNIMPNVYTLMDITDVVTKDPEFLTHRNGVNTPRTFELADMTFSYEELFSIFIRDRATPAFGPFSLASKSMSGNIAVTAWELVPFSFVIDWFINIGDFISAITGGSTADRSSTISWKIILDMEEKDLQNRRVKITGKLYKRSVTGNLSQYTCLVLKPDLSPVRQADAISLAWNAIRGNLIRSIR